MDYEDYDNEEEKNIENLRKKINNTLFNNKKRNIIMVNSDNLILKRINNIIENNNENFLYDIKEKAQEDDYIKYAYNKIKHIIKYSKASEELKLFYELE